MAERKTEAAIAEYERERAVKRGVAAGDLETLVARTIWVLSGRADDRVVIYERDPRHPAGEAFVAGSCPARVYRTEEMERLMLTGELVEVPAPRKFVKVMDEFTNEERDEPNPKYPLDIDIEPYEQMVVNPGRPTPLGRRMDPTLWDEETIREVQTRVAKQPREVRLAPGGYVPRLQDVDRPA
jgi:hypothetical protein